MSRFGVIKSDDKVFKNDKIRFDASKSFVTPDETLATPKNHEISFDAGVTWIDITTPKVCDFIYTSIGTKTVQLRITTTSGNSVESRTIEVLDLDNKKLFSKDSDLYRHEPEIDNLLPKKWSSWNLNHLEAQKIFMDWLDEKGIFNKNGKKYEVADLLDLEEVRQWSVYKCLELIYRGNVNVANDVSDQKSKTYAAEADKKLAKSQIALDYNEDGEANAGERTDLYSVNINRV